MDDGNNKRPEVVYQDDTVHVLLEGDAVYVVSLDDSGRDTGEKWMRSVLEDVARALAEAKRERLEFADVAARALTRAVDEAVRMERSVPTPEEVARHAHQAWLVTTCICSELGGCEDCSHIAVLRDGAARAQALEAERDAARQEVKDLNKETNGLATKLDRERERTEVARAEAAILRKRVATLEQEKVTLMAMGPVREAREAKPEPDRLANLEAVLRRDSSAPPAPAPLVEALDEDGVEVLRKMVQDGGCLTSNEALRLMDSHDAMTRRLAAHDAAKGGEARARDHSAEIAGLRAALGKYGPTSDANLRARISELETMDATAEKARKWDTAVERAKSNAAVVSCYLDVARGSVNPGALRTAVRWVLYGDTPPSGPGGNRPESPESSPVSVEDGHAGLAEAVLAHARSQCTCDDTSTCLQVLADCVEADAPEVDEAAPVLTPESLAAACEDAEGLGLAMWVAAGNRAEAWPKSHERRKDTYRKNALAVAREVLRRVTGGQMPEHPDTVALRATRAALAEAVEDVAYGVVGATLVNGARLARGLDALRGLLVQVPEVLTKALVEEVLNQAYAEPWACDAATLRVVAKDLGLPPPTDPDAEAVARMTPAECRAELEAAGIDVDASLARIMAKVREAKERATATHHGGDKGQPREAHPTPTQGEAPDEP